MRYLTYLIVAVSVLLTAPANAFALSNGSEAACVNTSIGVLRGEGGLRVSAGAYVICPGRGGARIIPTVTNGRDPHDTTPPAPPDATEGAPCEIGWQSAIQLDWVGDGYTGRPLSPPPRGDVIGGGLKIVSGQDSLNRVSENDASMKWYYPGAWHHTDQAGWLCSVDNNFQWRSRCDSTSGTNPCVYWSKAPPEAGSPQAVNWAPYFAQARGQLDGQAGQIGSAPPTKGVVNIPTCFWIDGQGIPDDRKLSVTVAGAPDAEGRQIYYTLLIDVAFVRAAWNFDDPHNDTANATPPTQCGQHNQLTAHQYVEISEARHPDQKYHVVAAEHYAITGEVYWTDSYGSHHQNVDSGLGDVVISTPDYPQYVGQIEAIPITPASP